MPSSANSVSSSTRHEGFTAAGVFADAQVENGYVRANWQAIRARLRAVGLYGGAAFVLTGLVDIAVIGVVPVLWVIMASRVAIAGAGWILVRSSLRTSIPVARIPGVRGQLFVFEILALPIVLLEVWTVPGSAAFYTMTVLLLVFALYACVPLLSGAPLWLGPLLSLPFMGMVIAGHPNDLRLIATATVLLALANRVGWQIAVAHAKQLRLAWADRDALEKEVAERRSVERALEQSELRARLLFEGAPVAMILLRLRDGVIVRSNQAAQAFLDAGDPARLAPVFVDVDGVSRRRDVFFSRVMDRQAPTSIELQLHTSQGPLRDTLVSAQPIAYEGQQCVLVGLTDVSDLKALQRQLQDQSEQDVLTRLPNRRGFNARARALLENEGQALALLIADLDHFKRVNDTYGHRVGDEMLAQIGALLGTHMRQADVVARFGGEEFVALLAIDNAEAALEAAERLRSYVELHPFATSAGVLRLSVSIGLALRDSPGGAGELSALLEAADEALYRAKHAGRNRVEIKLLLS
ncbi:MAG: sensor domain-containing diguanylate cyclase [Proteobacteria bacterium]|nr:sensor domain-containing diguanylate cyclase [Pseudomonadota bacterium]